LSKLATTGDPIAVSDNVAFNSRLGGAGFSVTPGGTIAIQGPAFGIRTTWIDRSGSIQGTVGKMITVNRGVAVLHNPERIVMAVPDQKSGNTSLWVYGLTRDTATRVTYSAAMEYA